MNGRVTSFTTGADVSELMPGGASVVSLEYDNRGTMRRMTSSYGTLVSDTVVRDDGRLSSVLYGDLAQTRAELHYDDARADAPVSRMSVLRDARLPSWDQPGYASEDALAPTQQLVLTDTYFDYDGVGNPTALTDVSPETWALGAASRARTVAYDDMNRVKRVTYAHTESSRVSRFAHEAAQSSDRAVPQASLPGRTAWQEFAYDYLGNIKSSTSDAGPAGRFDRSLGTPTYGTTTDGPNQLKTADGVRASYDSAGNLVDLIVERPGPCDDGRPCSQRTQYDWDELGQLAGARRWDLTLTPGTLADDPALVSGAPAWDVNYTYSGGQRVLKSAQAPAEDAKCTLEVFDSLRVEDTLFQSGDYARTVETEKLNLGGVGRVQRVAGTTPDGQVDQQRLFLAIGDELGSASFVLDHATGEVVERTSFDAYGTVDSDFRSERWGAYRNPHQFTGKEEDIEVGLVYFGARYYHPQLHRWMSPDPLTIHAWGADPNPYAYVSGNVLRLTDPTGLEGEGGPPAPPGPVDGWIGPPPMGGPGSDAPRAPGTGTGGARGGAGLPEAPRPPPPPPPQSSFGTSLMNGARAMAQAAAHAVVDKTLRVAAAIPKLRDPFAYNARHIARVLTFGAEPTRGSAAVIESDGTPEDELASVTAPVAAIVAEVVSGAIEVHAAQAVGKGAVRAAGRAFPNQLPDRLASELATAARVGVSPIRAGTPGFSAALNKGTIKWVVTESGELLITPHTVGGVEISHAVLSRGNPVLAAGQAEVASAGGRIVGIEISPHSGHFKPNAESIQVGIEAFSHLGIHF